MISAGAPASRDGNHGWYVIFDQILFRESEDDQQGLGLFGQYGTAPADRNEVSDYYGIGLVYKGLFNERPDDYLGVAYNKAEFSSRLQPIDGRTHEEVIEMFYLIQWNRYAVIQPDLQFIGNPGGDGRDALAAGIRCEIAL